jgi:hypothetical protein
VIRERKKLHKEELDELYYSRTITLVIKSRKLRWAGRGAYRILMKNPVERKPLERPSCRWENNIKTDLPKVSGGHVLDRSFSG